MKFRNLIPAAALFLLPLAANAATLIVPAAGTGPGANNSQWQSELTLHTAAPRAVAFSLEFHQGTSVLGPVTVTLEPRQTVSISDVVRTKFGVTGGTGAIVINVADRDAKTVAVTSRTFNTSPSGIEFGQDIPAYNATAANIAGDTAAIPGPSVALNRFNAGVYAVTASKVKLEVLRADGTTAATKDVTLAAGEHAQYNGAIEFIGAEKKANDTVHATVVEGNAIFYGSIVNTTEDPTFVPAMRTRNDIVINFLGVDLDENGTIDIADGDGDGVLDAPILVLASSFPETLRVVAQGEFGETVTFEVVSSPAHIDLLDARGTMRVIAFGDVKGTTGAIRVRATSGNSSAVLTIPAVFK
ncbi:MAG TPA: hypothetical protein VJZ00_14260 [Thermoanaerobaculia bacterium]|nr:hypothetical protein [Thermoanaerobaculia bacterium]